jgi:hypothetical protein
VLVHIGYHKSGSNWLRRHFFGDPRTGLGWVGKSSKEHPVRRIVAARPFEFDAAASRAEFAPLVESIEAEGLTPVVSFERLSGNPFSGGYDSKEIADRLKAVFPDARILVVIREQRSMIRSTYKQYVREGGALPVDRFMRPPTSKSMRVPLFDLRHFEYHHLIGYYRRLFGPEAVLALAFEQFVADGRAFAARIGEFAGAPLPEETLASLPYDARPKAAPTAVGVAWRRRLNLLGVTTDLNPSPLLPSRLIKRLALNAGRPEHVPRRIERRQEAKLRETIASVVGERYAESNRLTAELTGIDLGALGWSI